MKPEFWRVVDGAVQNIKEGTAERVDGKTAQGRFKAYRVPDGTIRIDLPKGEPDGQADRSHTR